MSVFNVLTLFGGLAMFLFGMELMGQGLESASGGKLEKILENLTSNLILSLIHILMHLAGKYRYTYTAR